MQTLSVRRLLLCTAALLALASAGCHKHQTAAAEGVEKGILLVGNGGEVQSLDPQMAGGLIDHNPISALYEGLVTLDEATLQPRPGLAEKWEISDDGLTYTFHLRAGLKWSNGEALTTADFLYSFKRAISPSLASEYKDVYFPVVNAEAYARGEVKDFAQVGFAAPDASTLIVHLRRRTQYFLTLLRNNCWYPVYSANVEKYGKPDDRSNPWTRRPPLVSNGPFRLVAWRDDRDVEVEKNPNYWDAAHVRLNGIRFFSNESLQGQELAFRAGQLHVTWSLPVSKVPAYRERNPNALRVEPSFETYFVRFNVTRKPFDDPRVRRAFSLAIDRTAIVSKVLNGGQTAAESLTPAGLAGYVPPTAVLTNEEEAKALLAAAGFPGGQGFPKVDFLTIGSETDQLIAEALQQMWRKTLGVDVGISQQEFKIFLQSISNTTLNYALARGRWIPEYPDPLSVLDIMTGISGINGTGFADKTYDSMLYEADGLPSAATRNAGFAQAETYLLQQSPIAPIYFGTSAFLIHPAVHGWSKSPLGFHNFKDVWLAP